MRAPSARRVGESSSRPAARSTIDALASNCAPKVFRRDAGACGTRPWTDGGLGRPLSKLATEAVLAAGSPGSSRSALNKKLPGQRPATEDPRTSSARVLHDRVGQSPQP